MTTMMPAPAGAEPDAVTLQIPAIPMTWEQASIMLDATFDAWRMLSGEIDAAPRRRLAMDPGDPRPARAHPVHQGRGRRGHGVLRRDARDMARQMA